MQYITLNQLRAKLGNRARSSIYLDIEAGNLPKPKKLGGTLYWNESEIDEIMSAPAPDTPSANSAAA
ncbi:helix-turn-helix transcriptional regulator [Roseobacter sp. EG26]|uniref:helix-turn-helix transcriptional regulator n=1 Tax=Roseobacter sp. EG26 TaxID=3412477 RepID=UPI003CE50794